MANKRMFSLSIVDTDLFLEMPMTSRLLYYELGMRADDDGFVGNWKKIIRMTGLSEDDMKVLIAKKFILPFESGVIVIRHWRINNYLRNDRHTPTSYQKELAELNLDNEVYELKKAEASTLLPRGIPTVDTEENSIDKGSIEKDRVDKISTGKGCGENPHKEKAEKIHFAEFVTMTNEEHEKLVKAYGKDFADQCISVLDNYKGSNGKKYKDDYRAILSWVVKRVQEDRAHEYSPKNTKTNNPFLRMLLEEEENDKKGNDGSFGNNQGFVSEVLSNCSDE